MEVVIWKKIIKLMNKANEFGMFVKVYSKDSPELDRFELIDGDKCIAILYTVEALEALLDGCKPVNKKSKSMDYINSVYESARPVSTTGY